MRMNHRNDTHAMPQIASEAVDPEGVRFVADWVRRVR